MKLLAVLGVLLLGSIWGYIDVDAREARAGTPGLRTLFFLRRISPAYSTIHQEKMLPYDALQKRVDSEHKFSPFHSVLVVRRKRVMPMNAVAQNADFTEAFLKDFLVSHLQRTAAMKAEAEKEKDVPQQFDTEKIYNDLYKHSKYPPKKVKSKEEEKHASVIGDEIDSIIASAAKELSQPLADAEEKSGKKAKRGIGKRIKRAKRAMRKEVKINGVTVALIIIIGLLSGYIGYSMRSRSTGTDNYAPLSK